MNVRVLFHTALKTAAMLVGSVCGGESSAKCECSFKQKGQG